MAGPQLIHLLEPQAAVTGLSGQHRRRETVHTTFGWFRELSVAERFDGTAISEATVEIRVNRLAAPQLTANWRIRDQDEVPYRIEGVTPSPNRQWWLVRAVRTNAVPVVPPDAAARLAIGWTGGLPDPNGFINYSPTNEIEVPVGSTGSSHIQVWVAEGEGELVNVIFRDIPDRNHVDNIGLFEPGNPHPVQLRGLMGTVYVTTLSQPQVFELTTLKAGLDKAVVGSPATATSPRFALGWSDDALAETAEFTAKTEESSLVMPEGGPGFQVYWTADSEGDPTYFGYHPFFNFVNNFGPPRPMLIDSIAGTGRASSVHIGSAFAGRTYTVRY